MNAFGFRRPTAVSMIEHSHFGVLRGCADQGGIWLWQTLDRLGTPRGFVDVSFAAGPSGPVNAHRRQLNALVSQLDVLTRAAAPMIFAELADGFYEKPSDPVLELDWRGAHLTGQPGRFSLDFACCNWPASLVAVEFRRWAPISVAIED